MEINERKAFPPVTKDFAATLYEIKLNGLEYLLEPLKTY